ncbi:xylulokinase [Truepera radiovictrix]|uniref:Xylulose kinase n=1 Tax=Truepera radiovictrix (strain DSM 17093 / CIP 108686 / LMG 22925 / RQ-24) TaxID=649638 RepID=D7CV97_TRURR|nr:xylulokinase [Truepera radiovictrix]ADI14125.1 xylulokinase [Truepera radiovictrix DSM 17093]WMT57314.1 xylulokinase [Truepera radiovictrix]
MTGERPLALGLDLGTSGVRAVAVDERGALVAEATRTYPLLTPRPGWTEQRPEDWVDASLSALAELAAQLTGAPVALGLSGQMHGLVALDGAGEPVRPALLWNDQRTGEAVRELEAAVPKETLVARTGNPAITGFQLPKLLWLRAAEPEAFARTRHVLLPKDFLGFVLSGERAAEPSDASGTGCFHLETKTWDEEVLGALGLSADLFPPIVPSHAVVGRLRGALAERTGLPKGLPVVAGAGDNAAAATGLGLSSRTPRLGSVSLGTSGVVFAPLKAPTPDPGGRVHLFCHADGGYHLLGVTLAAAGSLEWYRKTFCPERSFGELVAEAASSPPGASGVTFKPYLAGERTPHLNPDLRGSWTGLSLATRHADVVRALLEGVAFSLRDAYDIIRPLSPLERALVTGGGAKSELWVQMVADVLELPLAKPEQNQGAAYGAALLAWQGVGRVEHAADLARTAVAAEVTPASAAPYEAALRRYRSGH